jgi:HK97 family phage prohead protease
MPYFITDSSPDCDGWATVKEDGEVLGCHTTKQGAIDQAIAIALSEGSTYEGELRIESGPPAVIADIDGTLVTFEGNRNDRVQDYLDSFDDTEIIIVTARLQADRAETVAELKRLDIDYDQLIMKPNADTDSTEFKKAAATRLLQTYNVMVAVDDNEDIRKAYSDLGITAIAPSQVPASTDDEDMDEEDEMRQVDLTAPAYMRASARRGLEWYSEGLGGDGLVDRTIREARSMAGGNVSADKWVRIAAWIARHIGDLDSPDANPNSENFPSPGVVAMALWGGGTTKRSARRAQAYAEGVVTRLEAEQERANMKQETRNFDADFELRAEGDGMTFVGYAAKFNSPSEDLGGFVETIEPGAFRRSLRSRNDVKLLVNHDTGRVLASTRSGTMKLYEDEIGLRVEASLPNTTDGRDMAELLRRGDLNKMSFGFSVIKDSWNNEMTERTLKSVRLFETSIVAFPAYAATEAMVRSLDKAATRAQVDADELADAVLKLEEGADLSENEAELIKTVVNSLTPTQVKVEEETSEEEANLLELKRKQLDLLLKRN